MEVICKKQRAEKKKKSIGIYVYMTIITVLIFIIISGISYSSSSDYVYHTVQTGDRVWSIAEEYRDNGKDIRDTVDEILEINAITDNIYPGQVIKVPIN